MSNEFDAKIEVGRYGETHLVISRDDGRTKIGIQICDPAFEIPLIIKVFQHHLKSIMRDSAIPVQPATRGRKKLFKT